MILYLLRHGVTRANEAHLYCGSTDLPLSPEGCAALERAKSTGRWPRADRYYTSGMRRTAETLGILYPGATAAALPELREIDFGDFEMKSYEMLKEDPRYLAWISGENEKNVCPHGESGAQAQARAQRALDALLEENTDALAVTHGGVIAGAMETWFPEAGKNRYEWQPRPGAGYGILFEDGKPLRYWALPEA